MGGSNRKLLAVDPSLTCSGWALFDISSKTLLGVGSITTLGPEHSRSKRLLRLQENIESVFEQARLCSRDILICEDATSMKDPQAVVKLEQVRGIFETLARSRGVDVPGRIHPRTVQYELLGFRGKQISREEVKSSARGVALHLFRSSLERVQFDTSERHMKKAQDIVDALLIGAVATSRIEEARRAGVSLDECFCTDLKSRNKMRRVGGER